MDRSTNIICKLKYLKVLFIYYIMDNEEEEQPISDNESTDNDIGDSDDDGAEGPGNDGDDVDDVDDGDDEIDDELGDLKFPGDAEALTLTPDDDLEEIDIDKKEIEKPSIELFDQPGDDSSISDIDSDDEEFYVYN